MQVILEWHPIISRPYNLQTVGSMECGMPYLFPYENVFVVAVGALIIGLLLVRMYLGHQRRQRGTGDSGEDQESSRPPSLN